MEHASVMPGVDRGSNLAEKKERIREMHRTLVPVEIREGPLGSYARVKNLDNGRTVVVRINDRGPHARRRTIDLSYAAAQEIAMVNAGTAAVEVAH